MQDDLTKNHFELFGLPVGFDIDISDLSSRYRDLQRQFHPDRYASASDQERRLSLQMTARINEAFQTLKDPLRRGRYLLGLAGVDTGDETDTAMDHGFLMEQMELREELESVRGRPDPAAQLLRMGEELGRRRTARVAELGALLADADDDAYRKARNLLREMQFLEKLAREIDLLEEELI